MHAMCVTHTGPPIKKIESAVMDSLSATRLCQKTARAGCHRQSERLSARLRGQNSSERINTQLRFQVEKTVPIAILAARIPATFRKRQAGPHLLVVLSGCADLSVEFMG